MGIWMGTDGRQRPICLSLPQAVVLPAGMGAVPWPGPAVHLCRRLSPHPSILGLKGQDTRKHCRAAFVRAGAILAPRFGNFDHRCEARWLGWRWGEMPGHAGTVTSSCSSGCKVQLLLLAPSPVLLSSPPPIFGWWRQHWDTCRVSFTPHLLLPHPCHPYFSAWQEEGETFLCFPGYPGCLK